LIFKDQKGSDRKIPSSNLGGGNPTPTGLTIYVGVTIKLNSVTLTFLIKYCITHYLVLLDTFLNILSNIMSMSYLSKLQRNNKTYYYLVENIPVSKGKRKQIRKYIGTVKPTEQQLSLELSRFEKEINSQKKQLQGFTYLTKDEVKEIDDINSNFWKKYNTLTKTEKESFWNNFISVFVYNTNSIEGSTLTLKEVELLLSENISPNRPLEDVLETKSAKKAIDYLLDYKKDLSIDLITELHRIYFKESFPDIAGKLKRLNNRIIGSKFDTTPKELVLTDLKILIENYNKLKEELHPIELSAWVHWAFVKIHPFQDGNGRISRLLMNFVLYKNKYALIDIKTKEKQAYFNALERCNYTNNGKALAQRLVRRFKKQYKNAFSEL
jgi:fido (protein-threonine AMPylation protein)